MIMPKVTICIPHYNNKNTIKETLDSLLKQDYTNIEIKIFDNASTDGSLEILHDYEHKYENIQVFENEVNIGGEANFTKCIENLEGEYGAIFHADDLYSKEMVSKQVEFLEKNRDCSAVATHAYTIDEKANKIGFRPLPEEYSINEFNILGEQFEFFQSILKYANFITCPSVMARTKIYKNNIKLWNGKDFQTSADLDVWLRLSAYGKFGLISKPIMSYRESIASYSYRDTRTRVIKNNMFLVIEYYLSEYKGKLHKIDRARYAFLLFKDNINRTINEVIKGENTNLKINLFDLEIIQVALSSKNNLKIYIVGIIFKILRNIKLPSVVIEKIFQYRFGGKRS